MENEKSLVEKLRKERNDNLLSLLKKARVIAVRQRISTDEFMDEFRKEINKSINLVILDTDTKSEMICGILVEIMQEVLNERLTDTSDSVLIYVIAKIELLLSFINFNIYA